MFKPQVNLVLNFYKDKIVESDFNIKYHHLLRMADMPLVYKLFEKEHHHRIRELVTLYSDDILEYLKRNIPGLLI